MTMWKSILFIITSLVLLSSVVLSACAYSDEFYFDDYYYDGYYYDDDDYYYDDDYDHSYEEEGSAEFVWWKSALISLAIGLGISLIITGIMRSKMKSVRFNNAARNYIRQNSMNITRSSDMYLYSHVTKIPKPQNNKKR